MLGRRMTAVLVLALAASAAGAATVVGSVISLDGRDWLLAADPKNVGVAEKWYEAPRPEAKKAAVPGLIQDVFPGLRRCGVVLGDVVIPRIRTRTAAICCGSGTLIIWATSGERHAPRPARRGAGKFTLDATSAVKPGGVNRIAVRVLSPFDQPIEGFVRGQTPHGGYIWFNIGGILDSAELLLTPAVRIDDLFVRADPKTGNMRIEAEVSMQ